MKRIFFIPDQHFPYNDKKYWQVLLKAIYAFKPNIICVLGDFIDCYSISFHDKNPQRIGCLEKEVDSAKRALRTLERIKGVERFIYVEGNHEERLNRYLIRKAPELFNIVSIKHLLELKGWEYVPYRKFITIGKLHITHDVGRAGKYAAHATLADFQDNVVFGHTHRLGVVYGGSTKGISHVSAMLGWGGDLKYIDYMFDAVSKREWMLGFGLGYIESDGVAHVTAVPMIKYRCLVEGKIIK